MRTAGDNLIAIIAWLVGGFVLSVVALFSILGGYILALVLLAATPFILAFLALEAIFGKKPVYVTSVNLENSLATAPEAVLAGAITAQVVSAEGACPTGHIYRVGELLALNGSGEQCETAKRLVRSATERARRGLGAPEEVRCVGTGHRVIFALHMESEQAMHPRRQPALGSWSGGERADAA